MIGNLARLVFFVCAGLFALTCTGISDPVSAQASTLETSTTWAKAYSTFRDQSAIAAVYSRNRGLVVAGDIYIPQYDTYDAWLFHLDDSGNLVSQKAYGADSGGGDDWYARWGLSHREN